MEIVKIRTKIKFRWAGITWGTFDKITIVPVIPGNHKVLDERGVEVWVEKTTIPEEN